MSDVTHDHRACPVCKGHEHITVNDTDPYGYGPDPQCDEDVPCPNPECWEGWVRTVEKDPMERLHNMRRSFGAKVGRTHNDYRALWAKVAAPIHLPG